ncbi:MAG: LysR substrate-binding domain-containing protein, partial [Rhodospirillales bacterium]
LHDRDPNASWQMWCDAYGPADMEIRQGRRFGSSDLVLRAAEQGLGVALAHHRLARDSLDSGLLEPAFRDLDLFLEDAYWIISNQRHNRKAVQAFMDWLVEAAQP